MLHARTHGWLENHSDPLTPMTVWVPRYRRDGKKPWPQFQPWLLSYIIFVYICHLNYHKYSDLHEGRHSATPSGVPFQVVAHFIRVCSDLFIYCNPKHCLKSFKVYDCLTLASICSWPVMADLDALFSSDTEVRTTYVNVLVACHCLLYLQ